MANGGSLDANVLLRLLLNDIPQQHDRVANLVENSDKQFNVADIAIIEVAFALVRHYQFTRSQVGQAIGGLLNLPQLNCNRQLFAAVLPQWLEHEALSFEDCCLAGYARLNQAEPLWTFDRKLANQSPSAQLVP